MKSNTLQKVIKKSRKIWQRIFFSYNKCIIILSIIYNIIMWLEENLQINDIILSNLDVITVEQKSVIDKLDTVIGPCRFVLDANLKSDFLSEWEKSEIINEFQSANADIIRGILEDQLNQEEAEKKVRDNLTEKVRKAQQLITRNPRYQEVANDHDPDETDESEESED